MTFAYWIQLAFSLSNGLSLMLTMRNYRSGFVVLLIAHPSVAVYFTVTDQPFFLIGNAVMVAAAIYGLWHTRTKPRGLDDART